MTVGYGVVVKRAWTSGCGHSHLWTSVKDYEAILWQWSPGHLPSDKHALHRAVICESIDASQPYLLLAAVAGCVT
jgi:hypothetical protein